MTVASSKASLRIVICSCHCPVMVTVTGALAYRPGPARVSATASGPRWSVRRWGPEPLTLALAARRCGCGPGAEPDEHAHCSDLYQQQAAVDRVNQRRPAADAAPGLVSTLTWATIMP